MENEQIEQSKVAGDPPQQEVAASSRRRLLRAGLKATPIVVATLASRPSLACHCIVPSAWGSIKAVDANFDKDIENKTLKGSLARYNGVIRTFGNQYGFKDFNTRSAQGWISLRNYFNNNKLFPMKDNIDLLNDSEKLQYLHGTYSNPSKNIDALTVSALCEKRKIAVPNGSENSSPLAMMQSGSLQDRFGAAMFIALLNQKRKVLPRDCVKSKANGDILADMVNGYYTPDGATLQWGKEEIVEYLDRNWFARR